MRAPVAAMILALALGACASSSLSLPYRPEVQPSGATISAAYTIVADRLRVEIATDGRRLVMPRYTQPTPEQKLLLHQLQLTLPDQPPPRIQAQPDIFPAGMLRL